jgi:Proliferating cell nuclear antigen, C-terminal domain
VLLKTWLLAVSISVTKDGIKFSATGDIGAANVTVRQNNGVDVKVRCIMQCNLMRCSIDQQVASVSNALPYLVSLSFTTTPPVSRNSCT